MSAPHTGSEWQRWLVCADRCRRLSAVACVEDMTWCMTCAVACWGVGAARREDRPKSHMGVHRLHRLKLLPCSRGSTMMPRSWLTEIRRRSKSELGSREISRRSPTVLANGALPVTTLAVFPRPRLPPTPSRLRIVCIIPRIPPEYLAEALLLTLFISVSLGLARLTPEGAIHTTGYPHQSPELCLLPPPPRPP